MGDNRKFVTIPEKGLEPEEILRHIKGFKEKDVKWEEGKTWSLVYHASDQHDRLLKDASEMYFSANYLNPIAFKGLQMMEQEVVRMTAGLLNGDEETVGTMSSGGTESILLALYTYREWARKKRPGIKNPELVVPSTIHPAHEKAAYLLGMKLRKANVDKEHRAIPSEMEKLINRNTIAIAASAPSYPNGILDPIPEIGKLAIKHSVPMHVDSCIGGFMLPWVEKLGYELENWDFRVPGVTSMSADVHKFGYGAKGASVILYRSIDYLKYQFFITTDWAGGIYASPTIQGTRAGGPIVGAWAGMKHMGEEGYMNLAAEMMKGRDKVLKSMEEMDYVQVIGKPCMNIISYQTIGNRPDIYAVADQMENKGWMVDRQHKPDCIHLTILPTNVNVIDKYIADLKDSIEYTIAHPELVSEGNAAIYGMMARLPMRGLVKKNVSQIFERMYSTTSEERTTEDSTTIAPTKKWMGWVSRVLAWWRRSK